MFYIATEIHGRGIRYITAFDNRSHLWRYAAECGVSTYGEPLRADSIAELCHKLRDHGPGLGSRSHHRVSRRNAERFIKNGANAFCCYNL